MHELYLNLVLHLLLALGAALFGFRLRNKLSIFWLQVLVGIALVAIVGLFYFQHESVTLLRVLPFSSSLFWFSILIPLSSLIVALSWGQIGGSYWRRYTFALVLLVVCAYGAIGDYFMPRPECRNVWLNGVCLQTAPNSCSAAGAATLLKLHGILASEREMAELCMTRESGTTFWGLYRGLKLKTQGTDWDVEAFKGELKEVLSRPDTPAIIVAGLTDNPLVYPRYAGTGGWTPGVQHSVVFLGLQEDGQASIADPATGRELWTIEDFKVLWRGRGMRLIPRKRS